MKFIKNFKIRHQLLICFMTVITLFAISGILSMRSITELSRISKYADDTFTSSLSLLDRLDSRFSSLQAQMLVVALSTSSREYDPDAEAQFLSVLTEELLETLDDYSNYLYEMQDSRFRLSLYNEFSAQFNNDFAPMLDTLRFHARSRNTLESIKVLHEANIIGGEISDKIRQSLDYTIDAITQNSNEITNRANISSYISLAINIVSTIIALAIAISFGYMFGNRIQFLNESVEKISNGEFVNIYSNSRDEVGVLCRNIANVTATLENITKDVNELSQDHIAGKISTKLDSSKYRGGFAEIVVSINHTVEGLTGDINTFLNVVQEISNGNFSATLPMLPGEKANFNKVSDTMKNNLMAINKEINLLISFANDGDLSYRCHAAFQGDWEKILKGLNSLIAAVEMPIKEATSVLLEISKGNFETRITTTYKGDFGVIKDALNETSETLQSYIREISSTLNKIARDDLNAEITRNYVGEFIEIKEAINMIIDKLNLVFKEFNSSSDQVLNGAKQLSESNLSLSEGALRQSTSVYTLNDTIRLITDQIKMSVQKSSEIDKLSELSKTNAQVGDGAMKAMLQSMENISQSSQNISNIIRVIEDIAFQTNLLALNAAVEAARAGEHGKGFAVVAEEVRSLAGRSQKAAKETNELIENSISTVNEGTNLAHSTDKALAEIVDSIEKMSEIVSDISGLSGKQSEAINSITRSINEVSEVVDSNSALAEEGASYSQELSSQSEMLKNMIAAFNLKK